MTKINRGKNSERSCIGGVFYRRKKKPPNIDSSTAKRNESNCIGSAQIVACALKVWCLFCRLPVAAVPVVFESKEIQTEVSDTNNFHSFVKRNSCCAVQHRDLVLDWTKDGEISASPP